MKKKLLYTLFPGLMVLNGCIIFPTTDTSVTPGPSSSSLTTIDEGNGPFIEISGSPTTVVSSPASKPTIQATPIPTAPPVIKNGGIIKFIDTAADWGSLGDQDKARFIIQDFEHQRLVYREKPADPDDGGEFEFTWDEPPKEIALDQTITLNIKAQNNTVPKGQVGSRIDISFYPAGFFESTPSDLVRQGVGWVGTNILDQGTKQIKLKPIGISNPTWNENTKISIWVYVSHGPTLYYNYKLIRNQ